MIDKSEPSRPIPPAYTERADIAAAFTVASLYFGSNLRTPSEDAEIMEEMRKALSGMAQVISRVRRSRTLGPGDPLAPPKLDDQDTRTTANAKYGRERIRRWSNARAEKQDAKWMRHWESMSRQRDSYADALAAVKNLHDPLHQFPDYRLAGAVYRDAVCACTLLYFPPQPPGPERDGPTPQQEDLLVDQKVKRREQTAFDYGDREVVAAMLGGPFRVALREQSGEIAELVVHAATSIGMAWLVLSHPLENTAYQAEMIQARDRAYIDLGLCKSLVMYLRHLPRVSPGEINVSARLERMDNYEARLEHEVDLKFRERTYDASLTKNPSFRQNFDQFVDALGKLKLLHDRTDELSDYELGTPAYKAAVDEVISAFFPARITVPGLRRDVEDHRTRVRLRLVGPSQGKTDEADLARLRDKASYFAFAAEVVGAKTSLACPLKASLDELFAYFSELLSVIRSDDANANTSKKPLHGEPKLSSPIDVQPIAPPLVGAVAPSAKVIPPATNAQPANSWRLAGMAK